jgi:hypothetical protein
MRKVFAVIAVAGAAALVASAALAAGSDQAARASFVGPIKVTGAKGTLTVRYRCSPVAGAHLWVSAKPTKSGVSAAKLMKEGSSRAAAAWWDSHRNRISCNGAFHSSSFTIDKVEKGKKGALSPGGTAWVQFCITTGTTEKNTKLLLSRSGWVHVTS